MKVDFSRALRGMDGQPLRDDGDATITISNVCVAALLAPEKGGGNPAAEEMLKRYMLAQRIYGAGAVDITSTEATMILQRLASTHGTLVYGQLHALLEGSEETPSAPS